MNYYNEWDPFAAQWLRELIREGHIPEGYVDDRSITEVTAGDLEGFTQCHFFSGIGGWSYALRLAGVPDTVRLWTGSPPCQPFSVAGKQEGQLDPRHLAPTFMRLIAQCQPPVVLGEQVAAAISKHWLDDLFDDLEGQGYACGASVLPACSVGAPHKRDRLFFGGILNADGEHYRRAQYGVDGKEDGEASGHRSHVIESRESGRADFVIHGTRPQHEQLADPDGQRLQGELSDSHSQRRQRPNVRETGLRDGTGDFIPRARDSFWSDTDWLGCRDGKFRPVRPGSFPLVDGVPARMGRLRGFGNAIVPQVAAEFIKAFFTGAIND